LRELGSLKVAGIATKWNATTLEPRPTTKLELQTSSRVSFSSEDYFADLMSAASGGGNGRGGSNNQEGALIIASASSVGAAAFLVPQLSFLNQGAKSVLGLLFLSAPMALILLSIVAPSFSASLSRALGSRGDEMSDKTNERISYHEAGHLLCGYLCGALISDYALGGDSDSAIVIETSSETSLSLGSILVVAVAGMVAETLRFGDCKGGAVDVLVAADALRRSQVPPKEREGLLRWAVLKALALLRLHRDELDAVADAMREGQSVRQCLLGCVEGRDDWQPTG